MIKIMKQVFVVDALLWMVLVATPHSPAYEPKVKML
jgi:hypothetical protein